MPTNTYGARRGNHEVMMRGTFANIRLKNKLVERTGGWTVDPVTGEEATISDAAQSAPCLPSARRYRG